VSKEESRDGDICECLVVAYYVKGDSKARSTFADMPLTGELREAIYVFWKLLGRIYIAKKDFKQAIQASSEVL
jgi:hypothetical protein